MINKIYLGDCIEIIKTFPNNFVDFVFTSPPYNVKIPYDNYHDNKEFDEYWQWCEEWLKEIYRILKPDGRCCIVHYLSCGNSGNRYSPISMIDNIQRKIGFKHHAIIVWNDITISKYTAWGSWLSASSPYINCPFECILVTFKHSWKKLSKGKSTITPKEFQEASTGIWNIGTTRNKNHPAVFPEKLAKRAINMFTYEGDLVLDPFCGIGTTCVAAKKLNRNYIGIDISEKYVKLTEKKLKSITMKLF